MKNKNNKFRAEIKNVIMQNSYKNIIFDNSNKLSPNGFTLNSNENLKKNKLEQFNLTNNITKKDSIKPINKYDLEMEEYLLTDLDDLDYDDAIKKDKREFCEYFCKKLKSKQIIFNTFISVDPLRPRAIKIMLFILDIDLYFFVNALFFNEEYVSKVFHLKEEDNFFSFIQRSIDRFFYTTLVGVILGYITEFFFI